MGSYQVVFLVLFAITLIYIIYKLAQIKNYLSENDQIRAFNSDLIGMNTKLKDENIILRIKLKKIADVGRNEQ